MELSPPNDVRPLSAWQRSGQNELVAARADDIDGVVTTRSDAKLTDPPWFRGSGKDELPGVTGPAPPTVGVPQQCTTVQLVGGGRNYRVLTDGVEVDRMKLNDVNERRHVWLPRYRDVRSLPPDRPSGRVWVKVAATPVDGVLLNNIDLAAALVKRRVFSRSEWQSFKVAELSSTHYVVAKNKEVYRPDDTRRLAAPVCIALRVEEGRSGPLMATVHVRQRVWDHGTLVMDRRVQKERLMHHTEAALEAPYVLLPYPAIVTTPPHVEVIDADALRRWELTRLRWKRGRMMKIVRNAFNLFFSTTGVKGTASNVFEAATSLGLGQSWTRTLWLFALAQVAPSIGEAIRLGLSIKEFVWDGFESIREPPKDLQVYRYGIDELSDAIERIAETRANGQSNKRMWGLTPTEMVSKDMRREAALFYYLLYGNNTLLTNEKLRQMAEDEDVGPGLLKSLMTRGDSLTLSRNQWKLTGNVLSRRGLDPRAIAETRVEVSYEVEIEAYATAAGPDGGIQRSTLVLEPVRSNALDAGYLLQDMEGQLARLRRAVEIMREKLQAMSTYGLNWLHGRLLVHDTGKGSLFRKLNKVWFVDTFFAAQRSQQWRQLDENSRVNRLRNTPLVFDPKQFEKRMMDIVGREAAPMPSFRRFHALKELASRYKYGKRLTALRQLHRQSLGVTRAAYEAGDPANTRNFWRWVHHNLPVLGPGEEERLHAFIVPPEVPAWAPTPPALVRRLPNLGAVAQSLASTFGRTSLLKTLDLEDDDALVDRKHAKYAVDAAKRCWRITTEAYLQLRWTVELAPPTAPDYPMAFHFVECYDAPATLVLPDRHIAGADVATDVLCLASGLTRPLLYAEARYESDGLDEQRWARRAAAGSARHGDAGLLREFGIPVSRESIAALEAFATLLVHRVVEHNAAFSRMDVVQSAVTEARDAARSVADIATLLYDNAQRESLVSRDDLFFACLPSTNYARLALSRLDVWMGAQRRRISAAAGAFDREWPHTARVAVRRFASALRSVANADVTPTRMPMLPLQSLWFSINPTIERLGTAAGVDAQLRAAVTAFRRVHALVLTSPDAPRRGAVRRDLAPRDRGEESLQGRLVNALQRTDGRLPRPATPPEPTPVVDGLRARCAQLRLDGPLRFGDERFDKADTAIGLARRLAMLSVGGEAIYMVPPGVGVTAATPMDLSHASALEDWPVWVASWADELVAVRLVDAPVGIRAVSIGEEVGTTTHPQLIEAVDGEWRLTLTRTPPLPTALRQTGAHEPSLPSAVGDTLLRLRRMQLDVVDSPTWALRERYRAIMWNADRVAQLLLLLAAHGEERAVSLVAPDEWLNDVDSCAGLAVSVALGQAMLRYVYPVSVSMAVAMPLGTDLARPRDALSRVRAALAAASGSSAPVVVPLSEAVLVTGVV